MPLTLFPLKGLMSHGSFSILTTHVIICPAAVVPMRLHALREQGLCPQARRSGPAPRPSLAQGQLWATVHQVLF